MYRFSGKIQLNTISPPKKTVTSATPSFKNDNTPTSDVYSWQTGFFRNTLLLPVKKKINLPDYTLGVKTYYLPEISGFITVKNS